MNTPDITSEQVLAWLKAKADASGIKGLGLLASTSGLFVVNIERPYNLESGVTAEEAIEKIRSKIPTPEKLAQEKRDQAHRLLAEAKALDAEGKS